MPEEPAYNIISIAGQAGVGKTTLLSRFIEEAHTANFKDYCLTALVNHLQTPAASVMEKFAEQLGLEGTFKKRLIQHREILSKQLQSERDITRQAFLQQRTPDFAGAAVEGVPFVGPLLGEGIKATTSHLLSKYTITQMRKDAERLLNPIGDLTRSFIEELNRLADTKVTLNSTWTKHERRIVLFFDTFEQLAAEAVSWLLDHFLTAEISENVVLVIAGQYSLKDSLPDNPKAWQEYYDHNDIYSISLNSFTDGETRNYLAKRGITDAEQVNTIWKLSRGLPLYLGMLTSNPQGQVDPTAGVVANFLHWIPEQEQVKRRLALEAALFSKPFNLDDLEAFTYLPENERFVSYDWLIRQSFVLPQAGQHAYHELAQEHFSRHLYQRSQKEHYTTRRALADHYKGQLESVLTEEGKEMPRSNKWLELVLALTQQLLLLPDEVSHIKAIELIFDAHDYTDEEQDGEIIRVLRVLSQTQPDSLANASARQTAMQLQRYIEAYLADQNQESLVAISALLEKVLHKASFSVALLAEIYRRRGVIFRNLAKYKQAIEDFDQALKLSSGDARAYGGRGKTYRLCDEHQKAVEDLNHALEIDPTYGWAYTERGIAYFLIGKKEERAIEDFNRAIEHDPTDAWAYFVRGLVYGELQDHNRAIEDFNHVIEHDLTDASAYQSRGLSYRELEKYPEAIADFDHVLELAPKSVEAYIERGITYQLDNKYPRAIQDFDDALELDPVNAEAYAQRGETYRQLGDYQQTLRNDDESPALASGIGSPTKSHSSSENYRRAIEDFSQALKLDLTLDGVYMLRGKTYKELKKYPEAIADFDHVLELAPKSVEAYIERGETYYQLRKYQRAIQDFDQSLALVPTYAWAYKCRGWAYFALKDYQRAIEDFDQTITLAPSDKAYLDRGSTYRELKDYQRALQDIDHALELGPSNDRAYSHRAIIYRRLKDYQRALQDIDHALKLDPNDAWAYRLRGLIHLWLKDLAQSKSDFIRSWELDPTDDINGWLMEWSGMCQERPDPEMAERLKTIAMIDPDGNTAHVCRGIAFWLQKHFEEALVEYEKAIQIEPEDYDAYFWKGMTCASLEQDEEAMASIEKALELDLPPILLTPFRWFEQERPDFYEKFGLGLLRLSQGEE